MKQFALSPNGCKSYLTCFCSEKEVLLQAVQQQKGKNPCRNSKRSHQDKEKAMET